MTIEGLSSLSAHIAALRAEMSRKKRETHGAKTADDTVESTGEPAAQRDPEALRKQLVEIVRGVSMNDAQALDRTRTRVVKAVLLWEFGRELREHQEWQPMVEQVAASLMMDEGFLNAFNRLIAELQA